MLLHNPVGLQHGLANRSVAAQRVGERAIEQTDVVVAQQKHVRVLPKRKTKPILFVKVRFGVHLIRVNFNGDAVLVEHPRDHRKPVFAARIADMLKAERMRTARHRLCVHLHV